MKHYEGRVTLVGAMPTSRVSMKVSLPAGPHETENLNRKWHHHSGNVAAYRIGNDL